MSNSWDSHHAAELAQQRRWGAKSYRVAKRCKCGHLSYKRTKGDELCMACVMRAEVERQKVRTA